MNNKYINKLKQVKLILVKLDESFEITPYLSWFDKLTCQKIIAYHHYGDRLMSFTSQMLQNYYLATLLDVRKAGLTINYNKHHKPYLPSGFNCQFNIAHSYNYVVMGVYNSSDYYIGVDIEQIDDTIDIAGMSDIVFSATEKKLIDGNIENFFKLWTKKEALIKAVGTGFATEFYQDTNINLNDLEVTQNYCIFIQRLDKFFLSICLYKV